MSASARPATRPSVANFSSGPCAKRPGWTPAALSGAALGRSHRAKIGKAKLNEVIVKSKAILGMPADWKLGIVPGSDTGAVEMALWSMLGARGVDVMAWESFGEGWVTDITKQLKLPDVRTIKADYGRSIGSATWCSPGTAPLRVRACPMATGSPTIEKV